MYNFTVELLGKHVRCTLDTNTRRAPKRIEAVVAQGSASVVCVRVQGYDWAVSGTVRYAVDSRGFVHGYEASIRKSSIAIKPKRKTRVTRRTDRAPDAVPVWVVESVARRVCRAVGHVAGGMLGLSEASEEGAVELPKPIDYTAGRVAVREALREHSEDRALEPVLTLFAAMGSSPGVLPASWMRLEQLGLTDDDMVVLVSAKILDSAPVRRSTIDLNRLTVADADPVQSEENPDPFVVVYSLTGAGRAVLSAVKD